MAPALVLACDGRLGTSPGAPTGDRADEHDHGRVPGSDDGTARDGDGEATGGDGDGNGGTVDFAPYAPRTPIADGLARLSHDEYIETLRALYGDPLVERLVSIAQLPKEEADLPFSSMARSISSALSDAYFRIADELSEAVATSESERGRLSPCLAATPSEPTCVDRFIEAFGLRAFRRPLTPDEVAWLREVAADGATLSPEDGLRALLFSMLLSPQFLYRPELDGDPLADQSGDSALTQFELATRLSYALWGGPPDERLLQAASDGLLAPDAELDSEIQRMLDDPRAAAQLTRFTGEWLRLQARPVPQASDEVLAGIDPNALHAAALREVERVVHDRVFVERAGFADLWLTRTGYVDDGALAAVYQSPVADEPTPLEPARAGLLTRAGLLLGSGSTTHPIKRGAFVVRQLLCTDIAPPDPDTVPPDTFMPPPFDPDKSARQRWSDKTSAPACTGCHTLINGFGFALERYDTLGRLRDEELVRDPDTDAVVNRLPVDDAVSLALDGEQVAVSGAPELGQALAGSRQARHCFARQLLRFYRGREVGSQDAAMFERVVSAADGSVLDALATFAGAEELRIRRSP